MPNSIRLNQIQLPAKVAVLGKGMLKNNALLATILQTQVVRKLPVNLKQDTSNIEGFIGWGNKKSFQRAKRNAQRQNLPVYSIEDGFIRSLDSGLASRHALSMVIDDLGIYFDSCQSSRLEQMICHRLQPVNWSTEHQKLAKRLITKIIDNHLSKYNGSLYCPDLNRLALGGTDLNSTDLDNLDLDSSSTIDNVLLIDQVAGDKSIAGACINEKIGKKQFSKMLKDVLKNHPTANIWIKAHPVGNKGYLTEIDLPKKYRQRIRILRESVNPVALLKQVNHLYTVSSHMGFEGLLLKSLGHDIQVHCYGVSWYAGWGVTDDSGMSTVVSRLNFSSERGKLRKLLERVKQRRQQCLQQEVVKKKVTTDPNNSQLAIQATIEQLFFSAYLDYSHYADPASKQPCNLDTAINWLITNRKWQQTLAGHLTIYEFSRWKLPFVKSFVGFPKTELFIKPKRRWKNLLHPDHFLVNMNDPLLVWGLAKRQQVQARLNGSQANNFQATSSRADNSQTNCSQVNKSNTNTAESFNDQNSNTQNFTRTENPVIYCMEDGFVRSNGLGATLLAPLSVVIDSQGIYYNATTASDLEDLLLHCPKLTDAQIARVERLHQRLLRDKVSKYNVGKTVDKQSASWLSEVRKTDKKKILIVGQVEDDLSVKYSGSEIKRNADLIKRVQQDNTDAYLIYKPHPDVEAGLRTGKVEKQILSLVDAVAKNVAMPDCLALIDEVHTISSLTGFEALLRDKSVVCYGLPFYAGWGLTKDVDGQAKPEKGYLQRRQRQHKLTLQQLIHCTLIDYSLYRLPDGYGLAQVEQVIDYLYPTTENIANTNKTTPHNTRFDKTSSDKKTKTQKTDDRRKSLQQSVTQLATRNFMKLRQQILTKVGK